MAAQQRLIALLTEPLKLKDLVCVQGAALFAI